MKKPNIAVLGWKHGWKFIDSLSKRSDYVGGNLIAICGRTIVDNPPPNTPNVKLYNNYIKMFDELKGQLDGIVAALPNDLHLHVTEEAAKRGIAVLLEKPIAGTIDEANKIANIVNETKIPFMVAHHRRFSAKLNLAKNLIENGAIGKIVGASVVWASKKPDEYFNVEWRITKGVGGPLLINAIHDVDDLRYTIGEIEMVQAYMSNGIRGNDVEDIAVANFRFSNGALVSYFMSDGVPSKMFYEATAQEDPFFYPACDNCYFFFGQKGTLSFPTMKITSYEPQPGEGWTKPFKEEIKPVERVNPIDEETKHFCKMITEKAPSRCTAEDATVTLKVIEAIRESAVTGKVVYIK